MLSYIIDIDAAKPFAGEKPKRATAYPPASIPQATDIKSIEIDEPNDDRFICRGIVGLKFDRPATVSLKEIVNFACSSPESRRNAGVGTAGFSEDLGSRRASHAALSDG